MTNQIRLCLFCLLVITSCKPSVEKKENINNNDLLVVEEVAIEEESRETVVSASYVAPGVLINIPVKISIELKYLDKNIMMSKRTTKSGGMDMEFITYFDNEGREIEYNTIQNGEQSVNQKNIYDGDLLVKEIRVENAKEGLDTFIFEYLYEDKSANPLKYSRINNGTKVTEMTLTKNESEDILVERAVGSENYTSISTTIRKKDKNNNIISEQQTSITSDWSDNDKLDTTIYAPIIMEYNDEGLITRKYSEGSHALMDGEVESYYNKGIISKNIIRKKGRAPITVRYRKIR